jgi:uncharacterized protein YbbK (DUF523 family)
MRPRIIVSRFLGFDACRWNASVIRNDFTAALNDHVELRTICPEVEIGLAAFHEAAIEGHRPLPERSRTVVQSV